MTGSGHEVVVGLWTYGPPELRGRQPYWRASCSCGHYRSAPHARKAKAEAAGRQHALDASARDEAAPADLG